MGGRLILWGLVVILGACSHKNTAGLSSGEDLTVLKGVRFIDGMGSPVREKVNFLVREDRVEAIQNEDEPIPAKAHILDMSGKTVMPALMSSHVHLGMTNGKESGSKQITEENVLRQLGKFTQYGVGGVLSMGTDLDFIYQIRTNSEKSTSALPLVLTAGRGFGVPGGGPPISLGIDQVYRPKNVAEVKKQMAELASHRPNFVKIWVDDFDHTIKKKMDPEIYKAIIQEAHQYKIPVAAHVYYLEDAKLLAQEGVDAFAHSIRDQPVDMELMSLMKMHNIAYIPTLSADESLFVYAEKPEWMRGEFFRNALDSGKDELFNKKYKPKASARNDLKIALQNVMTLFKSGMVIGLGTDSGANPERIQGWAEHHELELLVRAGLTPLEAIRVATVNNANILGIARDYAGLQKGMKANFLILNEDPSENITNTQKISAVWLNGKPITVPK